MRGLLILIACCLLLHGGAEQPDNPTVKRRHQEYLSLLENHSTALGPIGSHQQGEIELITDLEKMWEIEQKTGRSIGICGRDKYWIWINDPVLFPSGAYSVYGRFLWNQGLEGTPGVCVVPLDSRNGMIYLICQYRHCTRSWEIELPRGGCEAGEPIWSAAARELKEETGFEAEKMRRIGEIASDTGATGTIVPLIFCEVKEQGERTPEDTEAIELVFALSVKECREGLLRGFLPVTIRGREVNVPMRDPFLALALIHLDGEEQ